MPPGEFRFHSIFGFFSFCKDVSKPSIFCEIICISKRTVVILISVLYYTAFFKVKNWIVLFSLSFVWFISGERISLGVIFPGGIFTRGNFLGGKFLGGNFLGSNFLGCNFPDTLHSLISKYFKKTFNSNHRAKVKIESQRHRNAKK